MGCGRRYERRACGRHELLPQRGYRGADYVHAAELTGSAARADRVRDVVDAIAADDYAADGTLTMKRSLFVIGFLTLVGGILLADNYQPLVLSNGQQVQLPSGSSVTIGAGTVGDLMTWAANGAAVNYGGSVSNACGSGSAATRVTLDALGSVSVTCATAGVGTVTSVGCGLNMSCSPSPITGAGTVATVASPTFTDMTITGKRAISQCDAGLLTFDQVYNDWSPACLGTNSLISAQAGDNVGNLITGIDANGKSLPVGSQVTVCNTSGHDDDSVLAFTNLDTRSAAGNRILVPDVGIGGRCSTTTSTGCHLNSDCPGAETCVFDLSRYYIGPNQCSTFTYSTPWASNGDATTKAWIIDGKSRMAHLLVQNLQFFPILTADSITGGSTVDDYNPTCTSGACGASTCNLSGGGTVSCGEAGSSLRFLDYSTVILSTSNSTGVTIKGFHYETQATGPESLATWKRIYNDGPGSITIQNDASATAVDNVEDGAANDRRGDIVLLPGQMIAIYHRRDSGPWYVDGKRDPWFHEATLNASVGMESTGWDTNAFLGATWQSNGAFTNSSGTQAGSVVNYVQIKVTDNGAYDTTTTGKIAFGIHGTCTAHRVAGGNPVFNECAYLTASGGDTNYNLYTDGGDTILDNGGGTLDSRGALQLFRGKLELGAGLQIVSGAAPTVNHGSLGTGSTNWMGNVTSIGANTAVTLTYGGSPGFARSWCIAVPNATGTPEFISPACTATTCVFSCINSTTGAAANCVDFTWQCVGA